MVHGAGEMHVEDERHARSAAETAIGETDALGLDELRGCGLMSVIDGGDPSESAYGLIDQLAHLAFVTDVGLDERGGRATYACEGSWDQYGWLFHGDCGQQSAGQRVALGEARGGAPVGEQLPGICRAIAISGRLEPMLVDAKSPNFGFERLPRKAQPGCCSGGTGHSPLRGCQGGLDALSLVSWPCAGGLDRRGEGAVGIPPQPCLSHREHHSIREDDRALDDGLKL